MHSILWAGIALLVFSGAGLLATQYLAIGSIAMSGMFYAKMTIELIILFNSAASKIVAIPVLHAPESAATPRQRLRTKTMVVVARGSRFHRFVV